MFTNSAVAHTRPISPGSPTNPITGSNSAPIRSTSPAFCNSRTAMLMGMMIRNTTHVVRPPSRSSERASVSTR